MATSQTAPNDHKGYLSTGRINGHTTHTTMPPPPPPKGQQEQEQEWAWIPSDCRCYQTLRMKGARVECPDCGQSIPRTPNGGEEEEEEASYEFCVQPMACAEWRRRRSEEEEGRCDGDGGEGLYYCPLPSWGRCHPLKKPKRRTA